MHLNRSDCSIPWAPCGLSFSTLAASRYPFRLVAPRWQRKIPISISLRARVCSESPTSSNWWLSSLCSSLNMKRRDSAARSLSVGVQSTMPVYERKILPLTLVWLSRAPEWPIRVLGDGIFHLTHETAGKRLGKGGTRRAWETTTTGSFWHAQLYP